MELCYTNIELKLAAKEIVAAGFDQVLHTLYTSCPSKGIEGEIEIV